MPTIAVVDGVKIQMFYADHTPPHFHASIGGDEVLIAIANLDVIRGSAPTCHLATDPGVGATASRPIGPELDQMPGGRGAREYLDGKGWEMPKAVDNVIVAAVPDPAAYTVALTWANGETTVSRFRHVLETGVFVALADPAVFAQVRIGERGRSLEWPGEIDFCADALWFEAHPEDAPEARTAERGVINS